MVVEGLKKSVSERHHKLIPLNQQAGMELVKEVKCLFGMLPDKSLLSFYSNNSVLSKLLIEFFLALKKNRKWSNRKIPQIIAVE